MDNASEQGLENILGLRLRGGWREGAIGLKPQKPLLKERWVCNCVKHSRAWIQPVVTAQGKFSTLGASLLSS